MVKEEGHFPFLAGVWFYPLSKFPGPVTGIALVGKHKKERTGKNNNQNCFLLQVSPLMFSTRIYKALLANFPWPRQRIHRVSPSQLFLRQQLGSFTGFQRTFWNAVGAAYTAFARGCRKDSLRRWSPLLAPGPGFFTWPWHVCSLHAALCPFILVRVMGTLSAWESQGSRAAFRQEGHREPQRGDALLQGITGKNLQSLWADLWHLLKCPQSLKWPKQPS